MWFHTGCTLYKVISVAYLALNHVANVISIVSYMSVRRSNETRTLISYGILQNLFLTNVYLSQVENLFVQQVVSLVYN